MVFQSGEQEVREAVTEVRNQSWVCRQFTATAQTSTTSHTAYTAQLAVVTSVGVICARGTGETLTRCERTGCHA